MQTFMKFATSNMHIAFQAGHFQDEEGQTKCDPCPKGLIAPTTASPTCTSCAAGKVSGSTAGKKCQRCPPGSQAQGGIVCSLCPPGTHSIKADKNHPSKCLKCAPGTASNISGTIGVCPKCPDGTFSEKRGGSQCTICPVGTKLINKHLPCEDCKPGESILNHNIVFGKATLLV